MAPKDAQTNDVSGSPASDADADERRTAARRGASAERAFVDIALSLSADIARQAEAMRRSREPEGPHQYRVALRRLRTLLKLYRPLLDADFYQSANAEARRLATIAGTARRLDVALTDLLPSAVEEVGAKADNEANTGAMTALAERIALAAAKDDSREQAAVATPGFLLMVHRSLLEGGWRNPTARARRRLSRPVKRFARRRLERQFQRVSALGRRLDALTVEERHALRKEGKTLRYAIAFFEPLFSAKAVRPMADAVRRLQNQLGALNDAAEASLLAAFAPEPEHRAALDQLAEVFQRRMEDEWPKAPRRWRAVARARRFWR